MLALEKTKNYRGKCTPNVLPCRVNHNGAVNASKRYWNPTTQPGIYISSPFPHPRGLLLLLTYTNSDGKSISYFRGRKLYGKNLKLSSHYRGVVLSTTGRILPQPKSNDPVATDDDGDEQEESPEVKIMEEQASFEEIVVWGHESLPEGSVDPYVRGMEEWIGFAELVSRWLVVDGRDLC